ncbi:hypothetical protein [Leptolyngbya sp. NIES-2104]|uniref:hypothetical protein n=1 Tax=Leptolyngbya sp. NIES-2104 TaxID=1552121 RepID=UPI0006EC7620|nr:hypothetical protein [Leptolyngbya sp. NIES-2104]GAP99394.1 hypothetical protein NIES2104_59550 [Leptolyngbya sp. NIES-2104]
MSILETNKSYTFSDIFKLKPDLELLLEDFGYQLQRQFLTFNQFSGHLDRLSTTQQRIDDGLRRIDLTSETARRESLIAPILIDVAHYADAQIRIEYPLKINLQLQGSLDYLLRSRSLSQSTKKSELLVVEAKQEDLTNGFAQLAVELIAISLWERTPDIAQQSELVGAVSTGTIWQFGVLHRSTKLIEQDLNLFSIPRDLEQVQRILVAALM